MTDYGLKTFCQRMAVVLGVDYSRLYEKQRRLAAEGLLISRPGKGPGSGVDLTPENLAVLLATLFAEQIPNETVSMMVSSRDFALRRRAA